MDLDLTDRRLLLEIDRAPVAPLAEIAHALGVGERTVSRRFTRLREEGLVRVRGRTRPGVGGRAAGPHPHRHSRRMSSRTRT